MVPPNPRASYDAPLVDVDVNVALRGQACADEIARDILDARFGDFRSAVIPAAVPLRSKGT